LEDAGSAWHGQQMKAAAFVLDVEYGLTIGQCSEAGEIGMRGIGADEGAVLHGTADLANSPSIARGVGGNEQAHIPGGSALVQGGYDLDGGSKGGEGGGFLGISGHVPLFLHEIEKGGVR
jgi:hypothetical protein